MAIDILGELFNKKAQITKDGFVCCSGIVKYINGIPRKCCCAHYTGTTGSEDTLIPHGLDINKIVDVDGDIQDPAGDFGVKEYNRTPTVSNGYKLKYDNINVKFTDLGVDFQNRPYKVKIEHWVE